MGCVDKVGSDYRVATLFNMPNGTCDTYGSFTLMVPAAGVAFMTNATLFRVDNTGTNLNSSAGHVVSGVWTTQGNAQAVPGAYLSHLFISTSFNPGPNDFLALTAPLSFTLSPGANSFYFFADSDDPNGGAYGFGLNVWQDGAPSGSPSLSGFAPAQGGMLMADGTSGCSPGYDGKCAVSSNTLSSTGPTSVTLASFSIGGVGGLTVVDAGASN